MADELDFSYLVAESKTRLAESITITVGSERIRIHTAVPSDVLITLTGADERDLLSAVEAVSRLGVAQEDKDKLHNLMTSGTLDAVAFEKFIEKIMDLVLGNDGTGSR